MKLHQVNKIQGQENSICDYLNERSLIGNMNVEGNMYQLKMLDGGNAKCH